MEDIKSNFLDRIKDINSFDDLKSVRSAFLGKKSLLNDMLRDLPNLSLDERKSVGSSVNNLRIFINDELDKIEEKLKNDITNEDLKKEVIDVTLPVRFLESGCIHPMVKVQKELQDILISMGFSLTDGSEIENDWNCFEGLNIQKHHPARQMQDTFYLKKYQDDSILLRTQTTSMEIREMISKKPPFKFICTGKVFRSEMDATHSPMFHQLEGVYVNKNLTIQDLKNCLNTLLKKFFNLKDLPLRLRPSYFPFTSPSIEIDVKYKKLDDRIVIGEGDDWIEILGAGMLHPNVLNNVNINSNEYSGFAFGCGIERIAMLKYGIKDIRNLYDGDIRFLKNYGFKFYER